MPRVVILDLLFPLRTITNPNNNRGFSRRGSRLVGRRVSPGADGPTTPADTPTPVDL